MLPSRFHPQFGDLQNVNARGPLVLRLETCRQSPDIGFTLCGHPFPKCNTILPAPLDHRFLLSML